MDNWEGKGDEKFRANIVLAEGPSLIPNIQVKLLTTIYNSSSQGTECPWPTLALTCTYPHTDT